MSRWIVVVAGILGTLGIAVGAFGSHGLEEFLAKQGLEEATITKRVDQCEIAVRYHLIHAVALLALGSLAVTSRKLQAAAALLLLLGTLLFCGGLYSMVFTGIMGHWAIVPLGGLSFILGWIMVVLTAVISKPV